MVLSWVSTWRAVGAVVLTLLAVSATSCADDDGTSVAGGTPTIVATTGIWADITSMVACDGAARVRPLVPTGADPHAYEPSLRDREMLGDAGLVVANGGGLEDVLDDTLTDVEDAGVAVFRASEHVEPSARAGDADDDPHIWFDPLAVRDVLAVLGDAVVAAGADAAAVEDCIAAARGDLTRLDDELRRILAAVPTQRRALLTNHAALGRFAARYDFTVVGSVLPSSSTLAEANPAALDELVAAAERAGVRALFTEQHEATGDAEALADRLGVPVVALYTDALGENEATTYADLLRYDATAIADALRG